MNNLFKFVKGHIRILWSLMWVQILQENRYVARIDEYSEIDYDAIVAYAAKAAQVPESTMYMAMDAIFDAISYFVTQGHSVELPFIGTFSFGINGKAAWTEEEAKDLASKVYRKKIKFLMTPQMRQLIRNVSFESITDDKGLTPSGGPQVISASKRVIGEGITEGNKNFEIRIEGANLSALSGVTGIASVYDADGNASEVEFELTSEDGRYWTALFNDYYGIDSITLFKDGNSFYGISFGQEAGEYVDSVYSITDSLELTENCTLHTGNHTLKVSGWNVDTFQLKKDGVVVPFTSTAKAVCVAVVEINADCVLTIADKTFNVTAVDEPVEDPLIQTLKCNGISVPNGGSSTIIVGAAYDFTAEGQNLSGLTQADIVGPGTVSNFTKSDSMVQFRFEPTGEGQLSIAGVFTVTLEEDDPEELPAIATVGGVANNGSKSIMSSTGTLDVVMSSGDFADVTVESSNPVITVTKGTGDKINLSGEGAAAIYFRSGSTTIFTLNVTMEDY